MKKRPVTAYFLLTFLVSWAFWSIPILVKCGVYPDSPLKSIYGVGVIGPIFAATVLSLVFWGKRGLKELYGRFFPRGVKVSWYLVPLLLPFLICLAALLADGILSGRPFGLLSQYNPAAALSALPFLLVFATMEEVGWRGFALPLMRKRFEPISSAILLGLVWGVWHLPKLLSEGMTDIPSLLTFEVGVIIFSVFISWLWENSKGSIGISVLAHASLNASIAGAPMFKVEFKQLTFVYFGVFLVAIALVLIIYSKKLKKNLYQ